MLIWAISLANALLGYLAAGILYPILVFTIMYLRRGSAITEAAGKAVNKLLNILNKDAAALARILIVALISKIIILNVFALPYWCSS